MFCRHLWAIWMVFQGGKMIGNLPWVRKPVQLEDPWGMRHQIKSDDQLRVATPPSFSEGIQGMPFFNIL